MRENWSQSRDGTLHSCERRYYYQYLAQARSNSRDPELREIAFLKRLRTIPAWTGEVFHAVVAGELRRVTGGGGIECKRMEEAARGFVEAGWGSSGASDESSGSRTSEVVLFEREYGESIPEGEQERCLSGIRTWIENFDAWATESRVVETLRTARRHWVEPNLFGPNPPGFELDGVWIFAKVDLAVQRSDGTIVVFDWKTGRLPSANSEYMSQADFQAFVYQLWPHITMAVPCEKLSAQIVYLGQSPVETLARPLRAEDRDGVLSRIRSSIARTRQFGSAFDSLGMTLADLDYAANTGLCRKCNFKRLCARSLDVGANVW